MVSKDKTPVVIIAENVEKEGLAPVIKNKLKGILMVAAVKAAAFGERKRNEPCYGFLATVIREDAELNLERVRENMLERTSNSD
uniref:TCP-1/cpn60 chaperonin family protein n=1 Tax=Tanacetum cinerariifolium TaxID=118510 RepID=A0A6L2LTE8_TANCI|nr:TCP-1/cpn60 chaperonin family protein [Tanacetum cinerariifolium]